MGENIQGRVVPVTGGAVYAGSDLKRSTTSVAQSVVMQLYEAAIPAASVARAIAFAIEQPADVDINEIVLRPTAEEF
jgi:NADP-dependent 3-hydroxy acid dehydrogenase YdfG